MVAGEHLGGNARYDSGNGHGLAVYFKCWITRARAATQPQHASAVRLGDRIKSDTHPYRRAATRTLAGTRSHTMPSTVPLWEMVNRILATADVPPVTRALSLKVACTAGWLCETVWGLLRLAGEPPITRFVAHELASAHWFSIEAARRDFGYQPEISIDKGLELLRQSFLAGKS